MSGWSPSGRPMPPPPPWPPPPPSQPASGAVGWAQWTDREDPRTVGRRRRRRRVGVVSLLVGVLAGLGLAIGGVVLLMSGLDRVAIAPVGCATQLDVDRAGTYDVWVLTRGTLPDRGGTCPGSGEAFELAGDDRPAPAVTLDGGAGEIRLGPTGPTTVELELPWMHLRPLGTLRVDSPGAYRLLVEPDASTPATGVYAVAVGDLPWERAAALLLLGGTVGVIGVVAGVVLLLTGRRVRGGAAR